MYFGGSFNCSMEIRSQIDPSGEGVAVFDPSKVLDRLEQYFPKVDIDPKDYSQEDVDKITKFVQETDPEKKAFLITSYRDKNRRNGPTYKFSLNLVNGIKIEGHARRYSVAFRSEGEVDEETRNKIIEFLESLKLGEIVF